MKVPWCVANKMSIPEWMEDSCKTKNCPHLVYRCAAEMVEEFEGVGLA